MMEIKVIIDLLGLPEAINNLAAALHNQTVEMNARQTVISAAPARQTVPEVSPSPVQPEVFDAPAQVAPAVTAHVTETIAPTSNPAPVVPAEPAKKYTREEIANAGSALVTQGKMNELLALLQKHGVQSVMQLNPNQYDAFVADLKALGANL